LFAATFAWLQANEMTTCQSQEKPPVHGKVHLLARAIAAHGGLDRWNPFNKVTATVVAGGGLLPMKGLEADTNPLEVTVTLHEESASISPFGQPDWRMAFTPDRVAIETTAGTIVRERSNPRASFAGHIMNTPWDLLHRAYFNGYARWTYLTTPFLTAMPGFEVAEISPWQEGGELWRGTQSGGLCGAHGSRTRSPAIAKNRTSTSATISSCAGTTTTSTWRADVLDKSALYPAAQYVYDIVEADGLRFPSRVPIHRARRRAYLRGPHLKPIRDLLMVTIDLSNFRLMA